MTLTESREPKVATKLIDAAGGHKELATLLGLSEQRVNNWRTRGIPADVILDHQEVFRDLTEKLSQSA